MLVIIRNLSNGEQTVAEHRASSTSAQMRAAVLREVDQFLCPNWRRGYMCNIFLMQHTLWNYHTKGMFELTAQVWTYRHRQGSHIKVYINDKSPTALANDERRLAVAMAFHPRLGERSLLGWVDSLVLDTILTGIP